MIIPPKMAERGPLKRYAREYNKLRDYVRSTQPVGGRNVRVQQSPRGRIIQAQKGGPGAPAPDVPIKRLLVQNAWAEYLTCRDDSGTLYEVAKPWELRPSSYPTGYDYSVDWEGRRKSVQVTNPTMTLTIDEVVRPHYDVVVSVYIYALKATDPPGVQTSEGMDIEWIDMNVDARHWAVDYKALLLCQNNVLYRALFGAGVPVQVP